MVIVGFQALGTTGRNIVDGAKKIRLFGEEIAVKARVYTINGFSAHAGQSQILDWLSHFQNKSMQVFLIHGEQKAQEELARLIRERLGIEACIPDYLEEVTLKLGEELQRIGHPEEAAPRIDWAHLLGDMEAKLARLRESRAQIESKAGVEQADLRDRLLELDRHLEEMLSEI